MRRALLLLSILLLPLLTRLLLLQQLLLLLLLDLLQRSCPVACPQGHQALQFLSQHAHQLLVLLRWEPGGALASLWQQQLVQAAQALQQMQVMWQPCV